MVLRLEYFVNLFISVPVFQLPRNHIVIILNVPVDATIEFLEVWLQLLPLKTLISFCTDKDYEDMLVISAKDRDGY